MTGQCLPPLAAVILIESFYKGRLALVPHLPLVQLLQSDLQSSCTMDLALWRRVAKAQSLDTLPELEFFWKQYDAESFSAPRHHPRNADTVAVLSQASAQCLTLLLQAQLASDAECKPLVMPSDAVAVTKVRMTLHILAHFISNWTAALSAVSNQQQSGSMSNMDQAVKEAGELHSRPLCKVTAPQAGGNLFCQRGAPGTTPLQWQLQMQVPYPA